MESNRAQGFDGFEFAQSSAYAGVDPQTRAYDEQSRSGRNKRIDFLEHAKKGSLAWGVGRNFIAWAFMLTLSSILISIAHGISEGSVLDRADTVNMFLFKTAILLWLLSYVYRGGKNVWKSILGLTPDKHSEFFYMALNAVSTLFFFIYFVSIFALFV